MRISVTKPHPCRWMIPFVGPLYRKLALAARQRRAALAERDAALRERDAAIKALQYPDSFSRNTTQAVSDSKRIADQTPFHDWGEERFLLSLPQDARVLDVGCGPNSPSMAKQALPSCYYVGVDVGEYGPDWPALADEYVLTSSAEFRATIALFKANFDAVMSYRNLEHCEDREGVLVAMAGALKPGGRLYLSFPSAASVNLRSRHDAINCFDDPTHRVEPPDFSDVIAILRRNGVRALYASTEYQPPIRSMLGLRNEAVSAESGVLGKEGRALWSFETVIWGERG